MAQRHVVAAGARYCAFDGPVSGGYAHPVTVAITDIEDFSPIVSVEFEVTFRVSPGQGGTIRIADSVTVDFSNLVLE